MPLPTSGNPPRGYITVKDAQARPVKVMVHIIGVVLEHRPPMVSNGPDMLMTFQIWDKSGQMLIRWFYHPDNESDRPQIEDGDVVILRKVKTWEYSFERIALSHRSSDCLVIPSDKIPAPIFNDEIASGKKLLPHKSTINAKPPTPEEQIYAITLQHAWKTSGGQQATQVEAHDDSPRIVHSAPTPAPAPAPAPAPQVPKPSVNNKFQLLKDVQVNTFYDVAAEVVKSHPLFDRCEVYVTDYTENPNFYDYGKERGDVDGDPYSFTDFGDKSWKGPHGQRTIQILLYEPHAQFFMQNINDGDFVLIRNLRIKIDRNGSRWEGVLHQDRRRPNQIDIAKLRQHDERMRALLHRRQEYWKQSDDPPAEKESKKQQKKRNKQKKAQQEKQRAQREQEAAKSESDAPKGGCNSYIVTEKTEVSPTRLADMIENAHYSFKTSNGVAYQLPFINAKFRTQVRVVDFYPPNLEDFSRSLDDPAYNNMASETQSSGVLTGLTDSPPRWEWAFYILVEDATQPKTNTNDNPVRIPLLVADQDAEYLLRLDATDLRHDRKALGELREKLWILCGNLEELKAARGNDQDVDSFADEADKRQCKPFECLVKQYGVEVPYEEGDASLGYHRMFRMFGTTIKSN